ncbi:hypothetical protein QW71_20080 [Paenibacillus sp. IHB B 3415]|nr:hypothetical protein QW71_20080 [Paenibacillus sp. IHB B 3415]
MQRIIDLIDNHSHYIRKPCWFVLRFCRSAGLNNPVDELAAAIYEDSTSTLELNSEFFSNYYD